MTIEAWGFDVWGRCSTNGIQANASGQIDIVMIRNTWLKIVNKGNAAGLTSSICVLCHPTATKLSQVFKFCQQKQIPICFQIEDAYNYQRVLVVGAFTAVQRADLTAQGLSVVVIQGATSTALVQAINANLV